MSEVYSEMQNVVNRIHSRMDIDQEGEYYRLEFGCERFKHISDTFDSDQVSMKEEPYQRWKWWKHH